MKMGFTFSHLSPKGTILKRGVLRSVKYHMQERNTIMCPDWGQPNLGRFNILNLVSKVKYEQYGRDAGFGRPRDIGCVGKWVNAWSR
jgi:hypothetical protein